MDPFTTGALIQAGGGILGGWSQRGRYKQALGDFNTADRRLGGMTGQMPFDPNQISAMQNRGVAGQTRRLGEYLDNANGLDMGAGMGGLWARMLGQQQMNIGNNMVNAKTQGFNRDFDINAMRARMAANRLGGI